MKFPTTKRIGVVKGDQRKARRCYNLSLKNLPETHKLGEKTKKGGR
jgi:hypothetical protein